MATLYPSRIDGYSQIRVVRDVTGEILAKDHNDLRSAILSIERTLGINPQKDFETFVARLDDSYNIIQAHAHGGIPKHIDSHIYTHKKIGTVDNLPLGTVKTQIQKSLYYINYICSISGASSIGTAGFSTEKNNYVVYSNNVQSQIQEIGSFLDKNVDFLGTSFDSHVIDGMLVSSIDVVNLTVNITAGFISSQGMQLKSSAQSGLLLLSAPGDGVYYVCASRNINTVVIIGVSEDDLANILLAPNSIIILAEVVLDSSTVTVTDMRRFGVFTNDKNGFTVGAAPINGNDGYGCDFLTLKTAVKHITLMKGSGKFINGGKITLVSDIIIDDEVYAEIELPDNIEIDGCGHSIVYSAVASLFIINSDNVTIKNLVITPNFTTPYSVGSFSRVAATSNVSNLKITDCVIESSGIAGADLEYLILIGDIPGAYSVNGAIIRNNNVAVRKSGINFISLGARLNNAIIEGNTIYHTYMESISSYVGGAITAGSYCKVINNFIHGGYDIGIIIHEGLYTDVQGNTIIGTDEVAYYMNKGILFNNSSSPAVSICIASNNIIHGVNTFGINCSYGTGYNSFMIIDSNIIDNKVEGVLQPVNMCSIFSNNLSETIVSNNMILYPGLNSHAIEGSGNVIGNYIYCTSEPSSTYDIFSIFVSNCSNAFISQNIILNCDGSGISMDIGCLGTTVIDNLIHNIFSQSSFSESSYSIYANADYMAVINNTVVGSELGAINRIAISCTGDKSIICGNAIHNMSNIGITTTGIKGVISNNILTEVLYGINCNNSESCAIKDNIIITDTRLNFISSQDAIYDVGSFSAVEGNYIYGFGQDSETNKLIQCTGNRSTVVANNYVVFCKGIGIDCFAVQDCKIYNNYIYCSYNAISTGNRNEVINNMIISPENYGIFVGGNNNHIYGNRIINSLNSCIYIRALPDMDTNEVVINHNYLYNSLYDCVYMRDVSSGLIFGNYIAMAHSFDSEVCLIKAHSCLNLLITGNYIINSNVGRVDGILTYGIYFSGCQNCAVNSNYLESSEESFFTGIYLNGSYQAMVSSNYITNASKYAIHMNSFSVLNRSNSIISGNYIYSSIPCICGILLSNIIIASVFGNQVYIVGSGSIGIDVGNTTGNSILLSSNMVTTTNNETSVVFSGIGIKVIGNIAIGGLAPNASYWDGGYSNSNANNVWDDNSVIPE